MMKKSTHIIKREYNDGVKLDLPIVWCGRPILYEQVMFCDLQHYALTNEQESLWGWPVCKLCVRSAIKIMEQIA